MKPENFAERKKIFFWLGALVAASILLLLLGLIFIYGRQALVAEARPSVEKPAGSAGLEKAAAVLNGHADRLLQLDKRFSRQRIDSVSPLKAIEDTRHDIGSQESELEKILDSLDKQGGEFRPLVASFRSLLAAHHEMSLLPDTEGSGEEEPSDFLKRQLLKAKSELRVKEDLIARLEKVGKDEPGGVGDNRSLSQLRNDYTTLQERFDQRDQQWQQQVDNLRHTNENLLFRLRETRSAAGDRSANTAGDKSISTADGGSANTNLDGWTATDDPRYSGNAQNAALERKTLGLSDDLRFAQVDCNLSRADARQVVYNAKQRKDLLTDALATLNDLARSKDPGVQKKARERIALLRSIASSVHD